MGMQFTPLYFMSKENLIGPIVILVSILIYSLFFNREIVIIRNSLLIMLLSTLFFIYYIGNITTRVPLKPEYMIYLAIIFIIFLCISFIKINVLSYSASIVFVFIYINLLLFPRIISHMDFTNANSNGIIAFLLLYFCFINFKESNLILRVINIYNTLFLLYALFFIATSRAAMLAFIVVLILYLTIQKLHKYFLPLIALLIIVSQAFTLFYIKLKSTSIGTTLNQLTVKYTGKNLFSGRERIWKNSIDEVIQSGNVWTGLGNNTEYASLNGYLHNLYVQLFYQSGFMGLLLMSALLLAIAYITININKPLINQELKVSFSYFFGILFLQVLEGHLIYRLEIISVLYWLIIALFVHEVLKNSNTNDLENERLLTKSKINRNL